MKETRVWSLGGEDPWSRKWQPTLVFLPGKSHGWKIRLPSRKLLRDGHDWAHTHKDNKSFSLMSWFRGGHFFEIKLTFHEIYPFRVYNSVFFVFSIATKLYNHHHYLISKPQETPYPLPLRPWQPLIYPLFLQIWLFWMFHISGIIQYIALCNWLLSLITMFFKFIHVVAVICVLVYFFIIFVAK